MELHPDQAEMFSWHMQCSAVHAHLLWPLSACARQANLTLGTAYMCANMMHVHGEACTALRLLLDPGIPFQPCNWTIHIGREEAAISANLLADEPQKAASDSAFAVARDDHPQQPKSRGAYRGLGFNAGH